MTPSRIRTLLSLSAVGFAFAIPARAQQVLISFDGSGGGHFGWSSDGLGDLNGDGFPELIAGEPEDSFTGIDEAGRVNVYSGRDGSVLFELFGTDTEGHLGEFVSYAGDVNQDGTNDFLMGAPFANGLEVGSGYAELRSGVDASLIYRYDGTQTGGDLGDVCAPVGDVNDDGWIDIAIGGRFHDGPPGDWCGITRVFSGQDGAELYTLYGTTANALFGSAIDAAGDVNGDGYDDFVVGAKGTVIDGMVNAGRVQLFSGFDGSVLLTIDGRHPNDGLGSGTAGVGDVNGDGILDLCIGGWQIKYTTPNGKGFMQVVNATDGHPLYSYIGDHFKDSFGVWTSAAGDVNHDGFPDFAVGANGSNCDFFNAGQVRVYSGQTGTELYRACGDGSGDQLGHNLALAGDVNQDGYDDLIAGSYWADIGGHDSGSSYVFSGCPAVLERVGSDLVGGNGLPPNLAGCGRLEGGDPLTFNIVNARPSTLSALIIGLSAINVPFQGGLLVPNPDLLIFVTTGSDGTLFLQGTWPNGLPPQLSTYFQLWINDPEAPTGWAASKGVRAVTP